MMEGALFDFDGVVVQSEALHMRTFLELLAPYGVKVSEARWYREFAGTGSRHIFEVLTKENGIEEDVGELVERRKGIYEARVRSGELLETKGILRFLEWLRAKKIKTAIVSGSHRTNVQAALDVLALGKYFDTIVSGDDMLQRKPDPEPFLSAAKELSLEPKNCVVFEDSVAGCQAARRAGMKLVVIESPALKSVGSYDLLIKDFTGLDHKRLASLF
jgi:beta-phosphoglucomutase